MSSCVRRVLFLLFFLSGFCGLLYQVIWTRLAFASFGIITPVLSVVISVFMLGITLGSWAGGKWIAAVTRRTGQSAIIFYAVIELVIGLGAFGVPGLFKVGEHLLLQAGQSDSAGYLFLSAMVIAVSLLPWCVCMGATFPFMMAFVKERDEARNESFSYLYLANVVGAMCGTAVSAVVLVELLGFRHSLWVGAAANFTVAAVSLLIARSRPVTRAIAPVVANASQDKPAALANPVPNRLGLALLFTTGFVSMAMEVVWTRAFTPDLKTQVYSFALVLFVYLWATCMGSLFYRLHLERKRVWSVAEMVGYLAGAALLPVVVNDPRWLLLTLSFEINARNAQLLLASIFPFCLLLGYLTPRLIDEISQGRPQGAGQAYAVNVLGCILGPVVASYVMLPSIGVRQSLLILAAPFLFFFINCLPSIPRGRRIVPGAVTALLVGTALFYSRSLEEYIRKYPNAVVRRDHVATVISVDPGFGKMILVNGVGMTRLTPVTKFMAHLPLGFHHGRPESALVICFGMGMSYRSVLSWDVQTTAVELVPSVKDAFGYYHADAAQLANSPKGRIVADDGRRYLLRVADKYDVILIDPPPPVEAAGSSLLYSREFYELAKTRLKPGGILQAWFPGGDKLVWQAVTRSVCESFPHVRVFTSVEGWGAHYLASMEPIDDLSPAQFLARLPERAKADLGEWREVKDLGE